MSNKLTKKTIKSQPTDKRTKKLISGVVLSLLLVTTPFLFYLYKFAPSDSTTWETPIGTIGSAGFYSVQVFMHALFTKITFVLLTAIWFLTSRNWWKYAILVPLTMFLFQLFGVINDTLQYIDEFDFWYSLPIIIPILFLLVYLSFVLSRKNPSKTNDLDADADIEIRKILSDEL